MRQHKKVPTEPLARFLKATARSPAEIAKALSLDPSTVQLWLKNGKMPAWMLVALEGLVRRQRASERIGAYLLVNVSHDQRKTVETLLKALGCTVAVLPLEVGS